MNIFSERIDSGLFERLKGNDRNIRRPSLDRDTAVAIVEAVAEAERPVLYVGWRRPLVPGEYRAAGVRRSHGGTGCP